MHSKNTSHATKATITRPRELKWGDIEGKLMETDITVLFTEPYKYK
jgi:hypothetical protein